MNFSGPSIGSSNGMRSAKSSHAQIPPLKGTRPDSAKGDRDFNIKTQNQKSKKEELLKEKRLMELEKQEEEEKQARKKDKEDSEQSEEVDGGEMSKQEEERAKSSSVNWFDPTKSPGLDVLFQNIDKKVVLGDEEHEELKE